MRLIKLNLSSFIVISFYTEGHYEKVIRENLLPTLVEQKVSYHVEQVPSQSSWGANTNIKPFFVKQMLKKYPDKTLIWLDADAQIARYPTLFGKIANTYDMGIFYLDLDSWYGTNRYNNARELGSGVIMLRNRPTTLDVVEKWCKLVQNHPETWEQKHLHSAVVGTPNIKVYEFPLEYSYIYSLPNGKPPNITITAPVIVQYQASREVKRNRVNV